MKECKKRLCDEFARILDAQGSIVNNVCLAQRFRNLDVSIMGRKTTSPLVLPQFFSFENMDCKYRTLNLGETVILQQEINPFIDRLRKSNIIVTALHNHWLFENPRLFYIHFEKIGHPLEFATNVAEALKILR